MKLLWMLTAASSLLGALVFMLSFAMNGGIGQASGFAASAALAVVPYVFTRCIQFITEPSSTELTNKLVKAIENKP